MITHYRDGDRAGCRWTKCGLYSADGEELPFAYAEAPTCLWCVSGRRIPSPWEGPITAIIEENSVKDIAQREDEKILEVL